MTRQVHFEIFTREGRVGGWTLYDALPDREEALKGASALLAAGKALAVRVTKEVFTEATGRFTSTVILEEGQVAQPKKASKVDPVEDTVPCFKPDDLYSVHARGVLGQLLADTLARWKLTVIELIHRADMLEKLEATGTVYQHAIQKVAVARASETGEGVTGLVKTLNGLCERAMARVYSDERAGRLKPADPDGIAAFAARCAREGDGDYLLRAGIAKTLAPARSWADKLALLLTLMPPAPEEGTPGTDLLVKAIDDLVAEIVAGGAALTELLGAMPNLGAALIAMAELFAGKAPSTGGAEGLRALAGHFAAGRLPSARGAIARRILSEVKGMRRLAPASLDAEVAILRTLAMRLVAAQSNLLSGADIAAAVTIRSKRLVTGEAVNEYLAAARDPAQRIERLLQLEENVLGAENKRRLAGFLLPLLQAYQTETWFVDAGGDPLARLGVLAALERRTARSGFQEAERRAVCDALDAFSIKIADKHGVLARLAPRSAPAAVRLRAFMDLLAAKGVTAGRMAQLVRSEALALARDPAVVRALAGLGPEAPEEIIARLRELLEPPAARSAA